MLIEKVEYKTGVYNEPSLIVLGCFDAIHAGHRELLKKARLQAKINGLDLGVMLFRDGKGSDTIFSLDERMRLLEPFNVKFVLLVDYNDEFKSIPAKDFLDSLCNQLNVKAFMSGQDFTFGAGAKGKCSTLKAYAADEENAIWYMSVKDVKDEDGKKISTADIKTYIESGQLSKANALLGSNFCLTGEVVKGKGRGKGSLGYPTANVVYPQGKTELRHGVYVVRTMVDDVTYYGVANLGMRPTYDEHDITLEAFFDNAELNLYGKVISVEFLEYVRGIEKFDSDAKLSAQIKKDVAFLSAYVRREVKE
ncbi:MAG: riboflavin biosynthesis protein RibF [Clostridia bacterium]|nr:riboflavin biosynthesis protein RibF [Clostridia bacterium]